MHIHVLRAGIVTVRVPFIGHLSVLIYCEPERKQRVKCGERAGPMSLPAGGEATLFDECSSACLAYASWDTLILLRRLV
jgi:hypothetical protein